MYIFLKAAGYKFICRSNLVKVQYHLNRVIYFNNNHIAKGRL